MLEVRASRRGTNLPAGMAPPTAAAQTIHLVTQYAPSVKQYRELPRDSSATSGVPPLSFSSSYPASLSSIKFQAGRYVVRYHSEVTLRKCRWSRSRSFHSCLSAVSGSTAAARRAGT